ncbi:MAG: amidohydrolase family protein [Algoriphagus sp.]|uniref:amidohydrolase family protein n=1 Tax=Algoriphagus sp. TaxID=1872435 RepID=UPI0017B80AE7|nr:amidohydrolase family protein [Algoriphagus sp.]NVJ86157.1 amidohydrolase family protein [Algoriphagus sp.]
MRKTLWKASLFGLFLMGLSSGITVHAQSDPTGKKSITNTYAITNATVHTSPGMEGKKASILIKNGVILGVGENLSIPAEAQIIEGDSLHAYAGFIDAASRGGITKPEDPERPKDFVYSSPPDEIAGITPWRSAVDQFDIESSQVNDLRKAGFTLAHILPDGGMIAGKGALVLFGEKESTNVLKENTSLSANLNGARGMYPGTTVGVMAKFRDVYQNTKLTKDRMALFASANGITRPEINPTFMAMSEVVDSAIPVFFEVEDDLEARRAISLQKELGFQLVLYGLEEYESIIDLLKESGAGVILKLQIPDDKAIKNQKEDVSESVKAQYQRVKEAYDKTIAQAGKLAAAGVPFSFSTIGAKANDSMKALQTMIEAGLSEKDALAALTTNAANALGIGRMAGTIENGKLANLVLSTGPIFDSESQIKHVVVDGKIFDYEVKAKKKNGNGETASAEVTGNWDYTSETPAGSSGGTISIQKNGNGYEGTITYDDPSGSGKATSSLSEISVSGSSLSFAFEVNAGGMSISVDVSGDVSGNTMDGSMNIAQFGSFPISATRNPN